MKSKKWNRIALPVLVLSLASSCVMMSVLASDHTLDYQETGREQTSTPTASRDFDPSKHEIVTALEGEPRDGGDIAVPFLEPCACGGRVVTYKTGETGFQKQEYHICKHGINGNVWSNVVSYVYCCQSCGSGAPFTRTVEEVRCNH